MRSCLLFRTVAGALATALVAWPSLLPAQGIVPGASRVNPKDGLTYVSIPAGSFEMGCVPQDTMCEDDEKPRHTVRIARAYWIGKTEVPVGAYERFARASGRSMPEAPEFNPGWRLKEHPIVNVDWNEAKAFCAWSGGRLPSEAEWEYAARGGRAGTQYPWGNAISHDQANYSGTEGADRWENTAPVGSFPANGFGLHDVTGNVREWVQDALAGPYAGAPADGSAREGTPSDPRVLRGGTWRYGLLPFLRVSYRNADSPEARDAFNGFRCVRDAGWR